VLIGGFYASYDHYPGLIQRCWTHLLRDIHDLTELDPRDQLLADSAAAVHNLHDDGKAFTSRETIRFAQQRASEERLLALCQTFLEDPLAVKRTPCRRLEKHLPELLVIVDSPLVLPTNNASERSMRHLVTSCKISGRTQSATGTEAKITLTSLFATLRLDGRNSLVACQPLLQSSRQRTIT
jgi:hypothetical protein